MSAARTIRFRLNGEQMSAEVATHENVVELLQRLGLTGARESCGQGLCGCCTVLVDGRAVSGCLYLAAFIDGADVSTIEQQIGSDPLDPVQRAFAECGAFQCGYCTPGFILMSRQLLEAHPQPTEDEIRHYLSGNLCRCAAYPEIVKAVQLAAKRGRTPFSEKGDAHLFSEGEKGVRPLFGSGREEGGKGVRPLFES